MKRLFTLTLASLCVFTLCLEPVSAQGKGKGKGKGKPSSSSKGKPDKSSGKSKDHPSKAKKDKDHPSDNGKGKGSDKKDHPWRSEGKFKDKDREDVISHWDQYKGHPHGLPPGLAKNLRRGKSLPPGWDKKVRSGWVVEDDWWGLFDRVPSDNLPVDTRLPKDTGMYLFGDRMVRVHEPSREVIDFVRVPTIKP